VRKYHREEVKALTGGRQLGTKRLFSIWIVILLLALTVSIITIVTNYTSSGNEEPINPESSGDEQTLGINFIEISTGLPTGDYNFIAFGNFNGDSFIDMAFGGEDYGGTANTRGLYAYTGDGGTSWIDSSTGLPGAGTSVFGGLAFGDADNDGNIELFAAYEKWGGGPKNGVGAWEWSLGSWSSLGITSPYPAGSADNIVLMNVTGNSGLDLAVATGNSGLRYYEGSGLSPISWTSYSTGLPVSNEYTALAVADMNKDGRPDIISGTYNNLGVRFYTQDASGMTWSARTGGGLPNTGTLLGITVGDVNNDTHMDIVYGTHTAIHILLGNSGEPTGTNFIWTTPVLPGEGLPSSATGGRFCQLQLADFDKDGDLDLLAPKATGSGGLHLYLGNGSTNPGSNLAWTELIGAGLPTFGEFYGSNYFDFDSDGDLDIAGAMWGNGGARAWLNDLTLPETIPPEILNVFIDGSPTQTYFSSSLPPTVTLTATIDDTNTGGSNISGANYTVGVANWLTSTPMIPTDLTWDDDVIEDVTATITTPTIDGTYFYCVYGWDNVPNNNITGSCATLTVVDDVPPEVSNVLIDNQPIRTVAAGTIVTLNATIDDTNTGSSNISGSNYTIGAGNWSSSTPMNAVIPPFDNPSEDVTQTINTMGWPAGLYDIYVYAWDELPNNNLTSTAYATLIITDDNKPPKIYNVLIDGQTAITVLQGAIVNINATLDDSLTGNSDIYGANYTNDVANWTSATPMNLMAPPTSPTEDFTAVIDTSTWLLGTYYLYVYGNDTNGNNNVTSNAYATLIVSTDVAPPEISNVLINGAPTQSYPFSSIPALTLTATIDDSSTGSSNISGANYTIGAMNWPGTNMDPVNIFDSPTEDVTKILPSPSVAGTYFYCVYGWDDVPNYNITGSCATLIIEDDLPPEIVNVLLDGLPTLPIPPGTLSFTLTAVIDETNTGGSNIGGANYTIGVQNWPGVPMNPTDLAWDEVIEDADATIPTAALPIGDFDICVYAWDSAVPQNNNVTDLCGILTIGPPPDLPPVIEAWEPGGTAGLTYKQGDIINITWNASDDNSLPANPINISFGTPVGWAPIANNEANDGLYLWDTAGVTCDTSYWIRISVYDSMGQTTFDIGNYSFYLACPFIDITDPIITDVSADPYTQNGAGYVNITANVTDLVDGPNEITVTVAVIDPDGNLVDNYTMTYDPITGLFYYNDTFTVESNNPYEYTIWANDTSGNFEKDIGNYFYIQRVVISKATIMGNVTFEGAGIANAKVELYDSNNILLNTTYTLAVGVYFFEDLDAGSYTIKVSKSGYETPPSKTATVAAGDIEYVDFELEKEADLLWLWIILIIIIIIILIIFFLLLWRKKKKKEAKALPPPLPVQPAKVEEPKKACIKCGKELEPTYKICPYCGSEQKAEVEKPQLSLCKSCGKELEPEYAICPYCGTKQEAETEKPQLSLCRNCGKELEPEYVICPYCGTGR